MKLPRFIFRGIIQGGIMIHSGVVAGMAITVSGEVIRPVTMPDSIRDICMADTMAGIIHTATIITCTIVLTEVPIITPTEVAEEALSDGPPVAAANRHLPKFLKAGPAGMIPEEGKYLPMPAKVWQGKQGVSADRKTLHRLPHRDAQPHSQREGKERKPRKFPVQTEPHPLPVKCSTADRTEPAVKDRKQEGTPARNALLLQDNKLLS